MTVLRGFPTNTRTGSDHQIESWYITYSNRNIEKGFRRAHARTHGLGLLDLARDIPSNAIPPVRFNGENFCSAPKRLVCAISGKVRRSIHVPRTRAASVPGVPLLEKLIGNNPFECFPEDFPSRMCPSTSPEHVLYRGKFIVLLTATPRRTVSPAAMNVLYTLSGHSRYCR